MSRPFLAKLGRRLRRRLSELWETALMSTAAGDWAGCQLFCYLPPVETESPAEPAGAERAAFFADAEAAGCF